MLHIEIDGKEIEGKAGFYFGDYADSKFSQKDKEGNEAMDGTTFIYMSLLQYDPSALVNFWSAATAHLKNDKPDRDKIIEALEKRADEDGDMDAAVVEAFKEMETAGFSKSKTKRYWKQMEKSKDSLEEKQKEAIDSLIETRDEMRKEAGIA